MKRLLGVAAGVIALALAGTAAALVPGVFDPGNTGCVSSTFSNGVLHLEKNCPTATNAAAGADITGLEGGDVHVGVVHDRQRPLEQLSHGSDAPGPSVGDTDRSWPPGPGSPIPDALDGSNRVA